MTRLTVRPMGWMGGVAGVAMLLSSASMAAVPAVASAAPAKSLALPALAEFHQRFAQPVLLPAGERVRMAFAYEYANLSFIEGDDGVIVVDAGYYPDTTRRALADYRQFSDKPIRAVIYTHIHQDHTGGIDGLLEEGQPQPVIYSPAGWEHFLYESTSVLMPMAMWRAFAQNGMLLPKGVEGAVGAGIGPVPTMRGLPRIQPPDVNIEQRTRLEIAGVTLELIPAPGDIASSHMMVWLPEQKVLFAGDILGGTFPYMETSRFELDRDPAGFVASLDLALGLEPEYVIGGHGRLLSGREDVDDVLTVNRDVIQFMIDQLERGIALDYSADQIIDRLELPRSLAEHPDLQPHYHRVAWMVRGMYLKRAGFVGDAMDLARHTDAEQARRLLPLLGGEAGALQAAQQALQSDDPRWAATLASYVLQVNGQSVAARELRQEAFRRIASMTDSSNERNRLLSEVARERGDIHWDRMVQQALYQVNQGKTVDELMAMFRVRVKPERAEGKQMTVALRIAGEDERYWMLRNGVLRPVATATQVAGSLTLSRDTLVALYAGTLSWAQAQRSGLVTLTGDAGQLVSVIE